jgi:FAD/FMN-containing dehydrogenase
MRKFRGSAAAVLRPKTTEEVAAVMKHCHQRGLAVVPQGGNTGLVGGSVPLFDEVVVSLELMNTVERCVRKAKGMFPQVRRSSLQPFADTAAFSLLHRIEASSRTLVCQAGCVLEVLDTKLAEHQLMMPLDLGAKGRWATRGRSADPVSFPALSMPVPRVSPRHPHHAHFQLSHWR